MSDIRFNPDPDLESLRQDTDKSVNWNEQVNQWLLKGGDVQLKKITSYAVGWEIIKIICDFIDGTRLGANGDWKAFASLLGFDMLFIQKVENFACPKGVTWNILSEMALQRNGTFGEVLQVIHELNRFDILHKVSGCVERLLMELNPITDIRCNSQLDSGIVSSETVHFVGEADNGNLENSPTTTMSHTKNSKEGKTPPKRPNKVVLLTFVDDGYDVAMEVAEIFRSSTPKIGVLILERNKEYLETSITGIHRWFNEVDYIIPIITEQYLWQIAPRDESMMTPESSSLDTKFARLIYVMMNEEYLRNSCLNYRVRPILTSKAAVHCRNHPLMSNSLFFSCRQEEEIQKMANCLATGRRRT